MRRQLVITILAGLMLSPGATRAASSSSPSPAFLPSAAAVRREQAYALLRAQRYKEAIAAYRDVLAQNPNDLEALRAMASAEIAAEDTAGAIKTYERLTGPGAESRFTDQVQLMRLYRKAGRIADLKALASHLEFKAGQNSEQLDALGELAEIGEAPLARAQLGTVSPAARGSLRGRELEALILVKCNDHARAAQLFLQLAREVKSRPDFANQAIVELVKAGKKPEALAEMKRLLPSLTAPQITYCAQLALEQKDLALAELALNRLAKSKITVTYYLLRAELARRQEDPEALKAVIEEGFRKFPNSVELRRGWAWTLLDQGDPAQALETITPLLEKTRPAAEDLQIGARAHRMLNHRSEAAVLYRELASRPANPAQALDRGAFFVAEGEARYALAMLARHGPPDKREVEWIITRCQALLLVGDEKTTRVQIAALDGALENAPASQILEVAKLYRELGEDAQVLQLLQAQTFDDPRLRYDALLVQATAQWLGFSQQTAARQLIREALAQRPKDVPSVVAAELLFDMGSPAEALEVLGAGPPHPSADLLRARIALITRSDPHPAEELAARWMAEPPLQRGLCLDLVVVLLELQDTVRARNLLTAVSPGPPLPRRNALLKAEIAIESGYISDGRRILHELVTPGTTKTSDRLNLAVALLRIPDATAALSVLRDTTAPACHWFRLQTLTAEALFESGDRAGAARLLKGLGARNLLPDQRATLVRLLIKTGHLSAAAAELPRFPETWLKSTAGAKLVLALALARSQPQSVEMSKALLAALPEDAEAKAALAESYLIIRRPLVTQRLYAELHQRFPEREKFVLGHAQGLLAEGRPDDARHEIDQLSAQATSRGQEVSHRVLLASVAPLCQTGDPQLALQHCDLALRGGGDASKVYRSRATCFQELDQPEEALANYERGLALLPELTLGDRTGHAGLLFHTGAWQLAEREYDAVLQEAPDDRDALCGLGVVYCRRWRTREKGLDLFAEVLERDPLDPIRIEYAGALCDAGRLHDAKRESARAVRDRPNDVSARLVQLTVTLQRRYAREAEVGLEQLKPAHPKDSRIELQLADVDGWRGPTYFREMLSHLDLAAALSSHRQEYAQRREDALLPELTTSFSVFQGTDTLNNQRNRVGFEFFNDNGVNWQVGTERRHIARRDKEENWQDVFGRVTWNVKSGQLLALTVFAGVAGDSGLDVLPQLEYRIQNRAGFWGSAVVKHARVEDAPESVRAGIESNFVQLAGGYDQGRWITRSVLSAEFLTDSNERDFVSNRTLFFVFPWAALLFDNYRLWSKFEPNPFDLYFAPNDYFLGQYGMEFNHAWGPYSVVSNGRFLIDRQDGDPGNGYATMLRISRRTGPLSALNIQWDNIHTSKNRRLGLNNPYAQSGVQVNFTTRF